ncbi:cysteine--tRNA ligase [Roseovarius pelagicus]|uniref:Cysteine--tRNA ligase n=1 Tax=Roseovarius pelagicus TaxID=2980108 RepID=A0ABY6D855_9RHOB|nr:cysteine--tRNA ligase [Roseovarius pelagicus]UXX82099.1 cysteine--tRNA ligase [Roseovarius pelagicus]
MTTIKLHNTKTRRKEAFTPLDPDNVRMYVCGPTVYDRAHLGNARPVVVFDVLNRLLRHVYGDDHVTYVRNFTDVDDKINARAAADNRKIGDITEETIQWFLDDMGALGALEPDAMPRATQFIPQMVAMIEDLIAKSHAYEAEGHVLFAVESYTEYGALSGRTVDDMIAGARVEVAPYKRNPMDFVLWKPSSDDLPGWDSPWGRGRPGWHIECSAMAYELLGESFDIHGGGNDLMFPHHENEIAQSCCAHPEGGFAQVWMHNEMLQVEGKKMSKSLGNFFTVRQILDGTAPLLSRAMTGDEIRMSFLLSHYRSLMDLSVKRRHEAAVAVTDFARMLGRGGEEMRNKLHATKPLPDVVDFLSDELDSVSAINAIREAGKNRPHDQDALKEHLLALYSSQRLLGFDLKDSPTAIDAAREKDEFRGVVIRAVNEVFALDDLSARIIEARKNKDFAEADRLRDALIAAGVEVKITREGIETTRLPHFDPAKLENLV